MNILKNFKTKVNNWLERLAKENAKNFGNGKLDCCHLNPQSYYRNDKQDNINNQGEI